MLTITKSIGQRVQRARNEHAVYADWAREQDNRYARAEQARRDARVRALELRHRANTGRANVSGFAAGVVTWLVTALVVGVPIAIRVYVLTGGT